MVSSGEPVWGPNGWIYLDLKFIVLNSSVNVYDEFMCCLSVNCLVHFIVCLYLVHFCYYHCHLSILAKCTGKCQSGYGFFSLRVVLCMVCIGN